MNETSWEADTILMPVPLRFAPQVLEYVAGLKAGRPVSQPHPSPDPTEGSAQEVTVEGQGPWNPKMVADLADAMPYNGVIALLERCAEVPGTWIIKSDVEQRLGISAVQLRNELAALSKLTKRLFGQTTWPMQWKKEQGSYYYRMDDLVAQWWLDSRRAR